MDPRFTFYAPIKDDEYEIVNHAFIHELQDRIDAEIEQQFVHVQSYYENYITCVIPPYGWAKEDIVNMARDQNDLFLDDFYYAETHNMSLYGAVLQEHYTEDTTHWDSEGRYRPDYIYGLYFDVSVDYANTIVAAYKYEDTCQEEFEVYPYRNNEAIPSVLAKYSEWL